VLGQTTADKYYN